MGEDDFAALLERVRAGDEAAAYELVDQYQPEICAFVSRVLQKNPRL